MTRDESMASSASIRLSVSRGAQSVDDPSPPDGFKQTKIGLIPEEWEITELGSTCQQRRELVQPAQDGTIRYVGLEHIDSGNPKLNRYGSDAEVKSAKSRFYTGDVLYGKPGLTWIKRY